MNIFIDLHHEGLYYSLHLLLEKRLGHTIYRPIGMDWFTEGYWEIAKPYGNAIDTVKQFLEPSQYAWSPINPNLKSMNFNFGYDETNDVYHIKDHQADDFTHKAITLNRFKSMNIDVMIASYIDHIVPYRNLIQQHKPNTKLVHQMGNNWQNMINYNYVKNILASTNKYTPPQDVKAIFYHQEFPTHIFNYEEPKPTNRITSFVNCLPRIDLYNQTKETLHEYEFKAYGASCPNNSLQGVDKIAREMKDSMFGYHFKPGGDGYGHILHNWFAVGRPVIINYDTYKHQMAGDMLIPDVNCINFNGNNMAEVCEKVRYFSEPTRHKQMCESVHNKFKEIVDFEKESVIINEFLHNLN